MRHDVGGGGGEEDAVAVVSGGEEVVWLGGQRAEERQAIWSCGTEAGPGFELRGFGEWGEQCGGEGAEVADVGGVKRSCRNRRLRWLRR